MMRRNRYCILTVGTLYFLLLGFLYMWSKFQPYIAEELGFHSNAAAKWPYTIAIVGFSVGILIDGLMTKLLTPKKSLLLGTVLLALGYGGASFLTPDTRVLLYFVYGLPVGLGTGVCYNALLTNVLPWFPNQRGLASGISLLGMGLTGLTLMKCIMAPWLFLPTLGWRFCFRLIALAVLAVGCVMLLFCQKPEKPAAIKKPGDSAAELTTAQMLKTGAFWCFTGWKAILFGLGVSVTGAVAGIVTAGLAGSDGNAAALATNAVAVFSLCNGLSRPVIGAVYDRLRAVKSMALIAALVTLASAALILFGSQPAALSTVLLALIAFCYGGSTTLGPSYISGVFGQKHYRRNHGVQALSAVPFTVLGSQGISAVYDATGSYTVFFIIAAIGGAVAFVLALACGPCIRHIQTKFQEE